GFCLGGGACYDNRNLSVADAFCRTHSGAKILSADAPVHTSHIVGSGENVMESVEHAGLYIGRQFRRPPHCANFACSAVAIALPHQHACERKSAKRAARSLADKAAHRCAVMLLLPQLGLGASAQKWQAGPIRIGSQEGDVALKSSGAIRAA